MPIHTPTNKETAPPRSDLEALTISEITRQYDVTRPVAGRWLREAGLYEPQRKNAGAGSDLGEQLLEMEPGDLTGDGER